MTLHHGDMREVLATMEPESIDAIVTDPPYEISFMNRSWDGKGVSLDPTTWEVCLRVLKPGGHLLAMGGTRTFHRIVVAIEDAGFEIRDTICWLYSQGFPKSADVSKAIDKAKRRDYVAAAVDLGLNIPGNNLHDWTKSEHAPGDAWWERFKELLSTEQWLAIEREVVGVRTSGIGTGKGSVSVIQDRGNLDITAPATPEAEQWQGWGTALKPAMELICMARKPLIGTVANNVLQYNCGAINIDGTRIGTTKSIPASASARRPSAYGLGDRTAGTSGTDPNIGRWPANVVLDEDAAAMLDQQSGERPVSGSAKNGRPATRDRYNETQNVYGDGFGNIQGRLHNDRGGASRFMYTAKASRAERNAGLDASINGHPTVKPLSLMRWLVRMVTPPDGVILDPFAGSGTTGVAAFLEGFAFIGIEQEVEYLEIARARIEHAERCGRQAAFEMGEPA